MIRRESIRRIVSSYDQASLSVGVLGSHSALDVLDGASQEGIRSVVVTQKGRDAIYSRYFRRVQSEDSISRGIVDQIIRLDRFSQITQARVVRKLLSINTIFVPNRSLTSYSPVRAIENFGVPLFGSRNLLRTEEREERENYYLLLRKADLPAPEKISTPRKIDQLAIVKLPHNQKRLERGFFTAASYYEYRRKSEQLIRQGVISREDLRRARIERYIVGPVFNLNFFYSPIQSEGEALELLGIDWRFESSLDGHVRLPAEQQLSLPDQQRIPEYTVVGHNSATLRESLLDRAFEMGEKFVAITQKIHPPGIIGPFTLQTCVDKDMNFYIYDVSPRIGGGTNAHASVGHPYGNMLYSTNMSTGRRIALEIKRAARRGLLSEIVT